ncbi:hypothetical protein CPAR01_12915 [Colletotrichum paranaense]|uniref:Uncharacterized protein n=1 Tax=Colletotrichum paranaense TaxID=1914294 RepID=A0ABQ9S8I5_9PEZI|nr:uncharacterized protein CPAR01_12915 [Colletotrichum paranaense]KAK1528357.1 hypothetical protein CPAR01_12915 [Colletotrichum paranaense]
MSERLGFAGHRNHPLILHPWCRLYGFPHNIGTASDALQTLGRHRRVHFCHP